MLKGQNLQAIAVELERQLKTKRDFIVPTSFLTMTTTGLLQRKNNGQDGIPLTTHAHRQLGCYCDIPRAYYDRMLEADVPLLASNVNGWLSKMPAKDKRLVRTLDGRCRSVLSDKFLIIDHWDVLNVLLPAITQAGCEVVSSEVTDSRMYIKALTPRVTGEIKKGQIAQAGLILSNSEIGCGRVTVSPLLYVVACSNGLIVEDLSLKRMHVGRRITEEELEANGVYSRETVAADVKAFLLKARDSVNAILDQTVFNRILDTAREAAGEKIEEPQQVIEDVTNKYGLNDTESASVMKHLIEGGDLTRWGLINAVTLTAHQDVTDYDRSVELEQLGGRLLAKLAA